MSAPIPIPAFVKNYPHTKKALDFAIIRHAGQFRDVSGKPYVMHCIDALNVLHRFKTSSHFDELGAAEALHDTVENTDTTIDELIFEFGELTASLVGELTSDQAAIKRISDYYLDRLECNPRSLYDAIADDYGASALHICRALAGEEQTQIAKALAKQTYLDDKLRGLSSWGLVGKLSDMDANARDYPTVAAIHRLFHHCDYLIHRSGRRLSSTHQGIIADIQETLRKANLY